VQQALFWQKKYYSLRILVRNVGVLIFSFTHGGDDRKTVVSVIEKLNQQGEAHSIKLIL